MKTKVNWAAIFGVLVVVISVINAFTFKNLQLLAFLSLLAFIAGHLSGRWGY